MADPLLSLANVTAGHGEAMVLHDIALEVAPGEALALLGRNGTGKTTLITTIMGAGPRLRAGTLRFAGQEIARLPSERRAALGLGWVPQERNIFRSLTVEENLTAVARPGPWTLARVMELFPRLAERRRNLGSALSGGEQQMLAIARGLLSRPKLLVIDELSLGLAPKILDMLFPVLTQLNREGLSILLVEQMASYALAVTHRTYVMENGRVLFDGESKALAGDDRVLDAYLGRRGKH